MTRSSEAGLGAMIRTWRERLPPSAVALPVGRSRRVAGLRREELADLAGVSVDYVVRLEQGRARTPSAQVVASLARALQLTTAERDHLYRLAHLVPPADGLISDHIPPGVHRVLTRLGDVAVAVFAADWRLVWWNRSWAGLLGDPSSSPGQLRNFARDRFPVDGGSVHVARWPVTEQDSAATDAAVVSDLRRATGRFPRDTRLAELIRSLEAGNGRFAELWAAGTVAAHREDRKTIGHPSVGPVAVDCDVLTDGDSELKIVIMTTVPGSADETKLRLAAIGGPPAPLWSRSSPTGRPGI
ncbi:helix-turn-helix transcriptional regulator [Pseudonocardia sp. DSM 110487]|uniref:helix-turn-helix domain-containing protein n=1 Tax=Pseudonocardia sp. DSM 110487 TaxID=2865833 RepID=UPI001C6A3D05|nr:helix-turn-helix transcriptional regulator [Pseudonocardia sp. DSM 110487]QYN33936.1 helix-turn-helix transcriptional regulator [Pseudonocardia sp. DSM 110487]